MHSGLVGLAVAAPFAMGVAATPGGPDGVEVFRFQDPAVIEASALVVQDGLFLTTNDSGDTGRVFAVDPSGRTVGVTHWSAHPTDCEALAPGGRGTVWVGDIGDNLADRTSVTITRIPVGRGERTVRATSYHLSYPGGATDAETLVRNPVTGRLYIASKNIFGGVLYAVPAHPDPTGTTRMKPIGHVIPVATDGSFFPDGRHLILRDYSSATVYAWPSLRVVGSFVLPAEQQGEGIAVAPDGAVYVSSEGLRSPVLRVNLPPAIRRALTATGPSSGPSAPAASPSPGSASGGGTTSDAWPWVVGGMLGAAALVLLARVRRPR